MDKLKIIPDIYTRFKDDIEIVVESLEKGSQLVEDKIIIDDTKKIVDEQKTDTKITMEIVQRVANSITQ